MRWRVMLVAEIARGRRLSRTFPPSRRTDHTHNVGAEIAEGRQVGGDSGAASRGPGETSRRGRTRLSVVWAFVGLQGPLRVDLSVGLRRRARCGSHGFTRADAAAPSRTTDRYVERLASELHCQPFSIIAAFHCSPVVNTSSCERHTWVWRTSSLPMISRNSQPIGETGADTWPRGCSFSG